MARRKAQDVFAEISKGSREVISDLAKLQSQITELRQQMSTAAGKGNFSPLVESVQRLNSELNTTKARMVEISTQYNQLKNLKQFRNLENMPTQDVAAMRAAQQLTNERFVEIQRVLPAGTRLEPVGTVSSSRANRVPGGHSEQGKGVALDPKVDASNTDKIASLFKGLKIDAQHVQDMTASINKMLREKHGDAFNLKEVKGTVQEIEKGIYKIKNLTTTQNVDLAKAEKQPELIMSGAGEILSGTGGITEAQIRNLVETRRGIGHALENIEGMTSGQYGRHNLKSVTHGDPKNGRSRLVFEDVDMMTGAVSRLDTTVDKFGQVTINTGYKFRSFAQGVVHDIGRLMMWTIAISAIYAPLQKLNDLKEHMIQTETKLAQAAVAMAGSQDSMSDVFDRLYVSASRAGEGLEATVDAFKTAYRAVGGEGSEFERLDNAVKLLDDGLMLAQLSTLSEAEAIDTLAAALNQAGKGFDHGTNLLNEWVRTTKVANVDLATLATGFATLGEAAGNSGISSSQLSAMVAVISENTPYEGTQVANIARSVVSGFQSEKAMKEMDRLGIAVKDTEGNFRSLHDLMMEIYSMRSSGLISSTDFSSLARAIGGGSRRQAPTEALLSNYGRVSQIEQLAKMASPTEAEDALKLQLDTVEVGAQRLDNAFQNLAMTLGEEGGMLRGFKDLLNAGTGLVDMLNTLMEIAGKAGPVLVTLGVAAGFAFTRSPEWRSGMKDSARDILGIPAFLKGRYIDKTIGATESSAYGRNQPTTWRGRGHESQFAMNMLGEGKGVSGFATSTLAAGLSAALIPAIANARAYYAGDDDYGMNRAGGNVLGGLAGAAVGAALGMVVPGLMAAAPGIGAVIGTTAGDYFVGRTEFMFDAGGGMEYGGFATEDDIRESGGVYTTDALEKAQKELFMAATGANKLGSAESAIKDDFFGLTGNLNMAIDTLNDSIDSGKMEDREKFERRMSQFPTLRGLGFDYEQYELNFKSGKKFDPLTETQVALQLATDRGETEAVENYKKAQEEALNAGKVTGDTTYFSKQTLAFRQDWEDTLKRQEEAYIQVIRDDRLSGDITGAKYRDNLGNVLGASNEKIPSTALAFGKELMSLRPDIQNMEDVFESLFDVFAFGANEAKEEINQIKGELADLENLMSTDATEFELATGAVVDRRGAELYADSLRQAGAALIDKTQRQALLGRADFSPIKNDITSPYSRDITDELLRRTKESQRTYYSQVSPEIPIDVIEESFESFALYIEEGGKELYEKFAGYDPQFLAIEQKRMEEEGLIGKKGSKMGFQQVDLDSSRRPELDSWLKYYGDLLTKSGYKLDPQDTALMYNDENIDVLHTDNIQLKLALEKLIDINQKQLDGMYNIPDGATFWVPLQAAYYGKGKGDADAGSLLDGADKKVEETKVYPEWDLKHKGFDDELEWDLINRPIGPEVALRPEDRLPERPPITAEDMREGWYRTMLEMEDSDSKYLTEKLSETRGDREIERDPGNWIQNLIQSIIETKPSFSDTSKDVLDMLFKIFPMQTTPINPNSSIGPSQAPEVTSNLNINLNTTTSLQVDGRALATVMKTYLIQDMVRAQSSQARSDVNLIV